VKTKWEDNIKINRKEIRVYYERMNYIHLTQMKAILWSPMNKVMNFWVP
jgi:hypothetical protein